MKINPKFVLGIIFLLTLGFRLYVSFTNTSFSSDESYFNLRLTENIIETKKPLTYDELSYSGRNLIYPQAFNYFLALFWFVPEYEKIIPAILSSLIVIIIYFISKKITNDVKASLFSSLLSAFIPIEIRTNVNQISIYSLVIPVLLLMILALLNLDNKKYFILFIILSFLLPLIHPISILFTLSLLFYLILIDTESINLNKAKKEAIMFSFFLVLLINFFMYKEALLRYGTNIIWQNIPSILFNEYFKTFDMLEIIYLLGIIPLFFGVIGIYLGLFKRKDNSIILLSSFILVALLLISLKLINLKISILFISLPLLIASSKALSSLYSYIDLTKFSKFKKYFDFSLIILIILLSILPSILIATSLPNYNQEIKTFKWLDQNTAQNSVILAGYDLGNILTYFSNRKNVADDNFLLAPNVEERLGDIDNIYRTVFEVKGLELIKKYNIKYIYASNSVLKKYSLTKIPYIENKNCFELIGEDIYEVKC